jgi:ABC-type transport system involved in multi-copper enzyme maturation permease subunit
MYKQIRSIALYTLLEALRNRLTWLVLIIAIIGIALSGFMNALALTESKQIQVALLAAFLRFSAVFLLATFVVTSMVREYNDKGLELLLSLALPRAAYLLGKLLGFAALAILPALLFGLLTLFFAEPTQSVIWTLSLLCELWIVAAFAMLCVVSFKQIMAALSATMGFYLLARSIETMQLISTDPLNAQSISQHFMIYVIDALAAILPHLEKFSRTEWLVYQTGNFGMLTDIAMQSAICLCLLIAAALFDLYRKNI